MMCLPAEEKSNPDSYNTGHICIKMLYIKRSNFSLQSFITFKSYLCEVM